LPAPEEGAALAGFPVEDPVDVAFEPKPPIAVEFDLEVLTAVASEPEALEVTDATTPDDDVPEPEEPALFKVPPEPAVAEGAPTLALFAAL